ncbi:MAG: hypothetical protein IIA45_09610 [Bacteroidetes bacterium]|nr:hypothetical protein [Bacteroidota bacterium]
MKNHSFIYIVLFAAFLLAATSCKRNEPVSNDPNPPVSDTPMITLDKVAPTTVVQFQDSIVFTISYLDGDGDLGFDNADSLSLYLTDNRVGLTEKYHIPPLAPLGTNIVISGELLVVLDHTALLDTLGNETTTYTIKIKDRAGNWSNEVESQTVTIKQ